MTGQHQGFGFVEFNQEVDAEYAHRVMQGVKLYGRPIRCNKASAASRAKVGTSSFDVGANLFVGNLSAEADERMLFDTFSRFGAILSTPRVMRDPETNEPKGFAFVCFADFDASDAAIAQMNGQYLAGRPINVQYALKKDSKGERHGSEAERLLARKRREQMGAPPMPAQRPLSALPSAGGAMPPPPQQLGMYGAPMGGQGGWGAAPVMPAPPNPYAVAYGAPPPPPPQGMWMQQPPPQAMWGHQPPPGYPYRQ